MEVRMIGAVFVALLVSCGTRSPHAESEPPTSEEGPAPHRSTQPLLPPCDTLQIGKTDAWRFIPLHCQLRTPIVSQRDSQQVRSVLKALGLPIDSIWVAIPQLGEEAIQIDSVTIGIGLYLYAGIIEEIELDRTGHMRAGNWSGRDGMLTIDRRTGTHTYGLWQ